MTEIAFRVIDVLTGPYKGQPFANPQPAILWSASRYGDLLDEEREYIADRADFRDFGDRARLASMGVFSTDRTAHKLQRRRQKAEELRAKRFLDEAYELIGHNRQEVYGKIAALVAPYFMDTVAFAKVCDLFDANVVRKVHGS